MPQLKREILEAAVEGLEARLARLDESIAMVRSQVSGGGSASSASDTMSTKRGGKRGLSPEGRRRIAEAARRRWAAQKSAEGQPTAATSKGATQKRGITEAGRKRLAEAMKQRWAVKRTATQAAAKTGASKKTSPRASSLFGKGLTKKA